MEMIYHVTKKEKWVRAIMEGFYKNDTFEKIGFIECYAKKQIESIANSNHKNEKGLVLLVIDKAKLKSKIQYKGCDNNLYPCVCGKLNTSAVIKAIDLYPNKHGLFDFPNSDREQKTTF